MSRRASPAELTRRVFEQEVARVVGDRPRKVALLLGGGVDGGTVGLAAHHLGHKVHAYTFQLGDEQTHDSKWAERSAKLMGWEWTCVKLPTSVHDLVRHWPRMYHELKCRKKREFECTWPFLFVYPEIQEKFVCNGLHAGSFFGLSRKAFKAGVTGKDSVKSEFDAYRDGFAKRLAEKGMKTLDMDYNPSCMLQHQALQRQHRLIDVNPFTTPAVYEHFMRYSWMELNTPKQKILLRQSFPEHLELIGVRNHVGYQNGGKIDDHFEKVLKTPVNYMKRSRTIDMFGDYWHASREDQALATIERLKAYYERRDRA